MSPVVGEVQRARLHKTFAEVCAIPSPTRHERGVADWLTRELASMGLAVQEDDCGSRVGADAGNLLVRLPGTGQTTVLLCAHMDTVPPQAALQPVQRDGNWINAEPGIIGADNKAAVAAMVELARLWRPADRCLPAVGVELLFTISEEDGLRGAREFDLGRLKSSFGYVFDHGSPVGEIITASPTYMRIEAEFRGRAAHAGVAPERGVNAITAAAAAIVNMPQGRLDSGTTANVGMVSGGTAANVVAERCQITAEVRAIEQTQLGRYVAETVDVLEDAANTAGCDVSVSLQEMFAGYKLGERDRTVALASRALRRIGYEPTRRSSAGGSDANAFRSAGFACTNLANGTENAHEPAERVSLASLEANLELMLALLEEAAA
ncbi:MAG: M20/M25/M40 family metallo-hydrolase [Solirubrobacteraceae bacterium]